MLSKPRAIMPTMVAGTKERAYTSFKGLYKSLLSRRCQYKDSTKEGATLMICIFKQSLSSLSSTVLEQKPAPSRSLQKIVLEIISFCIEH